MLWLVNIVIFKLKWQIVCFQRFIFLSFLHRGAPLMKNVTLQQDFASLQVRLAALFSMLQWFQCVHITMKVTVVFLEKVFIHNLILIISSNSNINAWVIQFTMQLLLLRASGDCHSHKFSIKNYVFYVSQDRNGCKLQFDWLTTKQLTAAHASSLQTALPEASLPGFRTDGVSRASRSQEHEATNSHKQNVQQWGLFGGDFI